MESILGIHINLPSELRRSIKITKNKAGLEYWGNYNFNPHITLYLSRFNRGNLSKLVKEIACLPVKPFKLKITSVKFDQEGELVFCYLAVVQSEELLRLHKLVLGSANNLRGKLLRQKDVIRIKNDYYNSEQKKYIKKYGYLRVLKFFNPHVTLGQVFASQLNKKSSRKLFINFKGKIFRVNSITVGLYAYDDKRKVYRKTVWEKDIRLKYYEQ